MIELRNVSKHFGTFTAVNNLSFTVNAGEVLGFLGPNGAGKSTTMKMITGFLTPSSGDITIHGHSIDKAPLQAKQLIGYLPEGAPCYADMTPAQFLKFIAQIRGIPSNQQASAISQVAEKIHITNVMHQPIETLSKGYKRRVGLAQALIHDPKVLILDEPTDGLDPNQKFEVRKLIEEIAQEKIIVISTHILEEVAAVCSRAVIISRGEIVADGVPGELESRSRYTGAVTISVKELEAAKAALANIDGVAQVEIDASLGKVTAFPLPDADIFNRVESLVRESQWEVNEIHLERGRLDDVFRAITVGVQ